MTKPKPVSGPMTRATKKAAAKIANRRGAEGPKKKGR
jgi:hypothetical protein